MITKLTENNEKMMYCQDCSTLIEWNTQDEVVINGNRTITCPECGRIYIIPSGIHASYNEYPFITYSENIYSTGQQQSDDDEDDDSPKAYFVKVILDNGNYSLDHTWRDINTAASDDKCIIVDISIGQSVQGSGRFFNNCVVPEGIYSSNDTYIVNVVPDFQTYYNFTTDDEDGFPTFSPMAG